MPDDVAASSGQTTTVGLPPEPESQDPEALDNLRDEPVEQLFRQLGEVREDLSSIMAEDARDFEGPRMMGGRVPMTRERIDRADRRTRLQQRERQLQAAIREQTAAVNNLDHI